MDHEYLHDMFGEWVNTAAIMPPDVRNKMAWFFKALRLEVLKALIPYEIASVAAALRAAETTDTIDSQAELHQERPATETLDQEQTTPDAPTNLAADDNFRSSDSTTTDEQVCREQSTPEPEYLMTEDPDAGWSTWATANHWAERLCEHAGKYQYGVDVLPTHSGRWGFYLYELLQPEQVWQYTATNVVIERLKVTK